MNAVGGGDIDDVESSGLSRLAATADASTRLPCGDVVAGAVFEEEIDNQPLCERGAMRQALA
jgi:hypothetical protein